MCARVRVCVKERVRERDNQDEKIQEAKLSHGFLQNFFQGKNGCADFYKLQIKCFSHFHYKNVTLLTIQSNCKEFSQ